MPYACLLKLWGKNLTRTANILRVKSNISLSHTQHGTIPTTVERRALQETGKSFTKTGFSFSQKLEFDS